MMNKAGGLIALIAGVFSVFAAGATLLLGGAASVLGVQEDADLVLWLGVGGVVASFAVIVLGALSMNARSRVPPALLMAMAFIGAIVGGTLVAVFMALALVGAVLALIGDRRSSVVQAAAVSAGLPENIAPAVGPSLSDHVPINNTIVWLVAFVPLLGLGIEVATSAMLPSAGITPNESYIWVAYLALYSALCWWDQNRLEETAGLDASRLNAWMCVVVPVYLYQRTRVCGHKFHYFTVWVACFVLSILLAAGLEQSPQSALYSEGSEASSTSSSAGEPLDASLTASPPTNDATENEESFALKDDVYAASTNAGSSLGIDEGPSFNCAADLTAVEQMICDDSELARADREVAEIYGKARLVGADPLKLRNEQRAFLKARNGCSTVECVAEAYRTRYEELINN